MSDDSADASVGIGELQLPNLNRFLLIELELFDQGYLVLPFCHFGLG